MANKIKVSKENLEQLEATEDLLRAILKSGEEHEQVRNALLFLQGALPLFESTTNRVTA